MYQNNSYTGVSVANAWQEFDISDFFYNGTDNLLVVTEIMAFAELATSKGT